MVDPASCDSLTGTCHVNQEDDARSTMLQLQKLPTISKTGKSTAAVTLWDAGSTLSFITFQFASKMQLRGDPVKLEIVTVGGEVQQC